MRHLTVRKDAEGILHVLFQRAVFDADPFDGVALDKGDCVASQEVVPSFWRLGPHARVFQLHPVAELHVVIFPGEASTRLLTCRGSV